MGRPRILAIVAGVITDILSSSVLQILFVILITIVLMAKGQTSKDVMADMTPGPNASIPLLLALSGIGAVGSLLGGFVTGWIARHHRLFNAFLTGSISVLTAVYFIKEYPIWYDCLGVVLTIGPAVAGGYFADLIFGRAEPPPARQIIVHP